MLTKGLTVAMMNFLSYRALLLLIFILFPFTTYAVNEIPDYPAEQIATHTYVIHGPLGLPSPKNQGFMNNPGFVVTNDGVVVIDPGSSLYVGRMMMRQIKNVTDKPVTHVFATHVHGDHWLGNQAVKELYPDAQLLGHPSMIAKANAGDADMWISMMARLTDGQTEGTTATVPTIAISDGEQLQTGGITFKVYAPSDAHSKTDIMIEVVEDSVMFLGDNTLNQRLGRMDDGTFRGNIAACDVAIEANLKHYVPGHGRTGDVAMVKRFRNYLNTLYQSVAVHYDEGMSDFEMKPSVKKEVSDYENWDGFNDELGRHISLGVLEVEQSMFE